MVWTDPTASDNSKQTPTVTCSVESASQFEIGETEVICEALDASGNLATCSFKVDVKGNEGLSVYYPLSKPLSQVEF